MVFWWFQGEFRLKYGAKFGDDPLSNPRYFSSNCCERLNSNYRLDFQTESYQIPKLYSTLAYILHSDRYWLKSIWHEYTSNIFDFKINYNARKTPISLNFLRKIANIFQKEWFLWTFSVSLTYRKFKIWQFLKKLIHMTYWFSKWQMHGLAPTPPYLFTKMQQFLSTLPCIDFVKH